MTQEEAIVCAAKKFPFKGYMTINGKPKINYYQNITKTVSKYLKPGSKILDFGCGPCDKTYILKLLGYDCYGCDDLNDHWHKEKDNKRKIISFAKKQGIKFKLTKEGTGLGYKKKYFDMIMIHDVLEHLHHSPRELLNDLIELVKIDGLIFITVPNAVNVRKRIDVIFGKTNMPRFDLFYWYPENWRGHVREYVKDDLLKLLNYLNLEKTELRNCDNMLFRLPFFLKRPYLLITKLVPSFKDTWLVVAKKGEKWFPNGKLPRRELERILNVYSNYM